MTKNQARYQRNKLRARNIAIEWQLNYWDGETQYSYSELANWTDYFRTIGRRYGLLREFRENAII